jgi:3-hydroxy-9,10-secoandrosta-1,3,5(10)-triene-9,17-dione monooxygenase
MPIAASIPSHADLLARAASLAGKLEERAGEAEALRRVPDATIHDWLNSGLHKTMQPRRVGGWSLGWDLHAAAALELGKGNASQAWVLTAFGDQAHMTGIFSEEAQDEVWDDSPDALVAASLPPRGKLVQKNGRCLASGTWPCAAGIDHASWLLAGGSIEDAGQVRSVYFLVPKSEAKIVDDWHVSGLAGAGAKSFVLDGAIVPPHRIVDEKQHKDGTGPGVHVNPEPSYRFPRDGASIALACVPLGTAAAMLEDFVALACDTPKRGLRVGTNFATALRIAESKADIDGASLALMAAARETMELLERGETPTAERRSLNLLKSAHAAMVAARAADRLYAAGGAKAILLSSRQQRYLLDIHALSAQDAFGWDLAASSYGSLRMGATGGG